MSRHMRCIAAASLAVLSLPASAASVSVEAFLITPTAFGSPTADVVLNAPNCTPGSTDATECVRFSRFWNSGDPPVSTGQVTKVRSVFDAGNVSQVPNFVMDGRASAYALPGRLHASTFVQIQGAGGRDVTAGGRSYAQFTDAVVVRSSVLPNEAEVTLKVLFQVSGSGGGKLSFGVSPFFQQVDVASDFGSDALEDYETSFTARVGRTYTLNYGLLSYTRMFSNGWGAIDVLNGRNNNSDYSNSAYLFIGGLDDSLGISVVSDTGYAYLSPSAVPLPPTAWMLLSGLPLLAGRLRRLGAKDS